MLKLLVIRSVPEPHDVTYWSLVLSMNVRSLSTVYGKTVDVTLAVAPLDIVLWAPVLQSVLDLYDMNMERGGGNMQDSEMHSPASSPVMLDSHAQGNTTVTDDVRCGEQSEPLRSNVTSFPKLVCDTGRIRVFVPSASCVAFMASDVENTFVAHIGAVCIRPAVVPRPSAAMVPDSVLCSTTHSFCRDCQSRDHCVFRLSSLVLIHHTYVDSVPQHPLEHWFCCKYDSLLLFNCTLDP